MNKKKVFLYFLGFCFLTVAWYYQYRNSMHYQRFVAVSIGSHMVEAKNNLEAGTIPEEKLRMAIQKELRGLGIELYGPQIAFLAGKLGPEESLKHLAQLNRDTISVSRRDKIEDYYYYGKKWAVAKMMLTPMCAQENPEKEKRDQAASELKGLLEIETRVAGRNNPDIENLWQLMGKGEGFKDACEKFLTKLPKNTLARLVHRVDSYQE